MDPKEIKTESTASLATDLRWQLVQRVAASTQFRRSPKLRDFLLYVSEKTLANQLDRVREQQIGSEVFGRPVDYSMSGDSIVRVEARESRRRLALYFETEGRDEPIVITLPKGACVPIFVPREGANDDKAAPAGTADSKFGPRPFTATPGFGGNGGCGSRRRWTGVVGAADTPGMVASP